MNVSAVNTCAPLFMFRAVVTLTVFLAVFVIATAGFVLPFTAHAQTPDQTDLDEGGGAPGESGGGTPSVNITASPSSIERGYSSQLTFSSSYVTRCAIDNGVGVVAANRSDVRLVSPTQTTTYRISCYGPQQAFIDEVTVTVVVPAPPPPPSSVSVSLASNPESISSGSASTLSWSSSGVTSCSINQGVGSVTANASGSRSVSPTQSATYVITCTTGQPSPGPTWQYSYSDISDLSCPVTQNASVYTNVPNCPYSPQGKSCTSGSCKINRANQSTCSIETDVYECVSSGSSTESSVSSATTVTVTQVPDLVGQVGGAVTATANQAVTLYGGVANQGMGDAGYFPNIVQVCDTNCATVNQVLAATAIDPLDAGGWQQVSAAYTPTTASAQFYRVCANNNTSWVNVHTESNYANNCSGWQNLTVASNILSVSCVASPDDTITNESVSWEAFVNNPGGTSSGQTWQSTGGGGYTKVCSGGSNTTAFQNTCAEGVSNGVSCSADQVGTQCKVAQDQDACAADGGTVYGSVQKYRCTANSTNAPTYTYSWSGTDALSGTSKQVAKSYSTVGTKQGTVSVQGSDGRTGTATCEAVVSAPADLTAGSVTPTSATTGSPVTLSATASNIGAGTSGSFPILFQVSETGALFNSGYLAGLSSGANGSGSASYTFVSAGSYQVRACANFNTTWTAITTESNYANNCGPWTTVTVASAQSPTLSCSVSSTSVAPGQSVTYSANPSGGATGPYIWTAPDGGSYGAGATASRSFSTPGTYAMSVDTSSTPASNCPNVIVAASWCMNRPTDLTITATPNRVRAGQSTTLAWSATGVNGENATCTVTGPGVSWSSAVTGVPECSASGSANPTINTQSTYTLTCAGVSESVTVNVIPNFQEF